MPLSSNLVTQFVKNTSNNKQTNKKETFVYGKICDRKEVSSDGKKIKYYVKIDGSDIETPVSHFTATVNTDERVIIMIKNRSAIITGNVSSASATSQYVDDKVDEKIGEMSVISDQDILDMWTEFLTDQSN